MSTFDQCIFSLMEFKISPLCSLPPQHLGKEVVEMQFCFVSLEKLSVRINAAVQPDATSVSKIASYWLVAHCFQSQAASLIWQQLLSKQRLCLFSQGYCPCSETWAQALGRLLTPQWVGQIGLFGDLPPAIYRCVFIGSGRGECFTGEIGSFTLHVKTCPWEQVWTWRVVVLTWWPIIIASSMDRVVERSSCGGRQRKTWSGHRQSYSEVQLSQPMGTWIDCLWWVLVGRVELWLRM